MTLDVAGFFEQSIGRSDGGPVQAKQASQFAGRGETIALDQPARFHQTADFLEELAVQGDLALPIQLDLREHQPAC
jgi:hypothetical protein